MEVVIASGAWEVGWNAIAGIATAVLAGLTWWLARSTRDLARQTDQDVRAAWRPVLVSSDYAAQLKLVIWDKESYELKAVLQVANVGRGPAINCEWVPPIIHEDDPRPRKLGTMAPSEIREITVVERGGVWWPEWKQPVTFHINIRYEDIARKVHVTDLTFVADWLAPMSAQEPTSSVGTLEDTAIIAY